MKNIKLYNDLETAIGDICKTPVIAKVSTVENEVLFVPESVADYVEIIEHESIENFINYKKKVTGPDFNEIFYTSTDRKIINIVARTATGKTLTILSNIYKDGIGIITYDGLVASFGTSFSYTGKLLDLNNITDDTRLRLKTIWLPISFGTGNISIVNYCVGYINLEKFIISNLYNYEQTYYLRSNKFFICMQILNLIILDIFLAH